MTSAKRGTDPSEATPLLRHEATTSESDQTTHYHSVTSHNTNVENNYSIDETQEQINALGLVRVTSAEGLDIEPDLERFSSRGSASVKRNNASTGNTDAIPEENEDSYAARFIDVSPARFWLIFVGVLIGYLIGFFDSTLMASSHPVITSYFNAANTASWLSTAFLLTSTAFLPLFGRISDAFRRKPVYLFSIAMFFLTTAWCGLAQSIGSFIAARALCGLGAGGVFSMGQIISSDLVRIEYRGVYQSYINLCYGTGSCLGLAFGGFLCDRIGWRGAFFIQLPFIFVYFLTAASTIPADLGIKRTINSERMTVVQLIRSIDLTGAFILATAVTALIMGLNLGGNVFPGNIRCLIIGNFFGAISVNTVMFNVPLYFQAVKLASPTDSGLRLVAASIAITASSVGTGFLITWSKRMKPTIILGGFCMLLGGCTAASLNMHTPYALAMICVSFSSLGQGFSFPSVMVSVLATSEQDDQAVATTTLGLARNLGAVMERNVKGVEKDHIIALVRKSIRAISSLDPLHQHQVIGSYATALRGTFLSAALWGALMLLLHSRLRLPRLGSKA
ncbi:major facilitator superfamily-domain-containing protein [Penicillium cosmopolitanum]|uniref:Major facilitator superfamily-domain-containing protein n=1 Tax=Penicillium cosmopolitanum TaxID=1131564 RepID=A0A9X0BAL1_9EURO|nr:major facilitator superfamily-domain-containing protein [Penicillium cosmopolitanum]KAJ5397862.1 major facilitator superfamily-domain-containing protein [Penicillium cosmopolitanum]